MLRKLLNSSTVSALTIKIITRVRSIDQVAVMEGTNVLPVVSRSIRLRRND